MLAERLTKVALLTALSLSLFLAEGFFPLPFPVPGAKLGLANIVTVTALYLLPRPRDVWLILLLRTTLASFFGGGPTVLLYSLAGGAFSLTAMALLKGQNFSLYAIGMAGGFFHHVGQLAAASLSAQKAGFWYYLPVLGPIGLATGFIIAAAAGCVLARIRSGKLNFKV